MRIRGSFAKGISLALLLALIPSAAFSAQKVTAGSVCKVFKQKPKYMNKTYTCVKSGKSLMWVSRDFVNPAKATSNPKKKVFLVPFAPAKNNPITWENIESRYLEISTVAWQSTQDTLKENNKNAVATSIKVLYAPQTATSHYSGFENHLRTGIKLWNRFILPPNSTFLIYSYSEIPWAKKQIEKILIDSGMNENEAAQRGEHFANAPYGGPECGGANAGMITDSQAIGVFGLCPRNEGTDPYYEGPLQIHEFTHQMQGAQFIGTNRNSQQILPCWISEGLAHTGGLSAGTKSLNDYLDVRKRQVSHPVLGVAGGHSSTQIDASTVDLNFMKKFYEESAPPGCFQLPSYSLGYSVGFLTTEALASIGGVESTLLLFSRAAAGETFEEAFKNIYGLSWGSAKEILAKVISKEFSSFQS